MPVVLRAFVAGSEPLLAALAGVVDDDSDRNELQGNPRGRTLRRAFSGALGNSHIPGSANWAAEPLESRTDWWINRVGRVTASISSVSGQAGPVADRAALQSAMTIAGRGLVLCAMASERGVTDQQTTVRLLAAVLFKRSLPIAEPATDTRTSDELLRNVHADLGDRGSRQGMLGAGRAALRLGRTVLSLRQEILEAAPSARGKSLLGVRLPSATRIVIDYRLEREALQVVAQQAADWFMDNASRNSDNPGRPPYR